MSLTALATVVLASVDWSKVLKTVATDSAGKGAKSLLGRLKPSEREKYAKQMVEMFVEEFVGELEDKTPLNASLPGYHDQLKRLIEHAAPDIADYLKPDTKEVDLAPIERMWSGIGLDPLPADFDWGLVAGNFARDIRGYVKRTPQLREQLVAALLEEQTKILSRSQNTLARIAGPDPGFDVDGYRAFLSKKCGALQLSAMHTSTYDRRIDLWSVFVPQSARQSVPVRDLPRGLLRRMREEQHLSSDRDETEIARMREAYQSTAPVPVLEALARERLAVVLGDPGSGKTSLLKFLVMRWVEARAHIDNNPDDIVYNTPPLPLWIDLKEYVQERIGILKYLESGCVTFHLDAEALARRLNSGSAAIYLDGLDEIFDGPTRGSVVEEIAAFAARYREPPVVVTSRIIGYEADRLRNAGFAHLTLEEFDDRQVGEFIAKWHEAAEDDPSERVRLKRQIEGALKESRAVRELAGNPLLLTMTAILNRTQPLPRNRVELYEQASRVLLYEWDASRSLPVDTFARQEKEALLRELAGAMQQGEGGLAGNLIDRDSLITLFRDFFKSLGMSESHAKAVSLANQLTERNFILCYAGANRFSFVHRTFLEYFCAARFVELFEKKQTLTLEQMKTEVFGAHWKDEEWHEVLRLIAGMVGEKKAEELILFLMQQDGRMDKLTNLALAAECLGEVRNRRMIRGTDEALWLEITRQGVRFDPPYHYGPGEEYDETRATREKFVSLMASVWPDARARDWLRTAAERDLDWIVRRASVRELAQGWKYDPETLPILKGRARSDAMSIVRVAAVQELARGWNDDPETLHILKECARSDAISTVRMAAVQELARGWKDDPETLPWLKGRARSDGDDDVLSAVVQELARGWKDDPETLPTLKERARSDEHYGVRRAALQELARGWNDDPETLPMLKERARSDEHSDVRSAALQELARGWKDDPETLPMLKERARSDAIFTVRMAAVQELARGWKDDPETPPMLKERARSDENNLVRIAAVRELARGWRYDPETVLIVRERARSDEDSAARITAVRELARGWSDDPETLSILKEHARSDGDSAMRIAAAHELARGWKDDPDLPGILADLP